MTTVTFYVQELTNIGELQTIAGVPSGGTLLSSLGDSTTDFIIGGSGVNPNSYDPVAIDEVRLSSGILAIGDLLISPIPKPTTAALIFGMGSIAFIALSRRQKR